MLIEITEVRFKNFMSYQEEAVFKPTAGVSLISGKNGLGKSTILESVYYGLFGKPFRKIGTSELMNSVTSREMLVNILFKIGTDEYHIVRGIKPQRFEIHKNNEIILQDSKSLDYQKMLEESIIKTTGDIFKQTVLLGANIPTSKNFSDLSNKEREELFKYIIDIGIFSEYHDISKNKIKELKQEYAQSDIQLKNLDTLFKQIQTDIRRQEEHNNNFDSVKQEKLRIIAQEIRENSEILEKITTALKNTPVIESNSTLITSLQQKLNKTRDNITFVNQKLAMINKLKTTHSSCLTCEKLLEISGVDVTEESKLNEVLKSLNINFKEQEENLNNSNKIEKELEEKQQKIRLLLQKSNHHAEQIKSSKEKETLLNDMRPNVIDYSTLDDLKNKETLLIDVKKELENKINDFLTFQELVSDKALKGKILDMSLPLVNKWINHFLENFGNFPFLFTINTDLSESILSMDGSNQSKSFNSLSNGQKLRIVFSILFAFLKFTEERNTTNFNILFLDEVLDSSLDTEGRIELINILRTQFSNKSINIISHNQDVKDSEEIFENIYEIVGSQEGSKIILRKTNEI